MNMLNKKNIAMAMAAATTMTAVAPMANVVFADVVDNTQAEEIKALKEKVYGVFNAKYTENKALLQDGDNAGQPVFSNVTLTAPGKAPVGPTNYADFVKEFDKAFAKLNNSEKIMVSFDSNTNVARIVEEEYTNLDETTIVDFDKAKFADIVHTGNSEGTGIKEDDANFTALNLGKVKYGELADGKHYAKLPISGGKYITVFNKDIKLDLNKPKFKVVDGYYVDANGNSIKKFNLKEDCENATIVTELVALGGVVEGYYEDTKTATTDTIEGTYAIVKTADSAKKEDLTVGDIYEASTGRLTKKGNELVKTIYSMIYDEEVSNEDNLRGKLVAINKAGEVVETLSTENPAITRAGAEAFSETFKAALKTLLDDAEVATFKVIFETTTDENAQNKEWTPAYEATITEGRNENFEDIAAAFIGVNKMPVAAGMNRYATAVEASRKAWTGKLTSDKEVVLVSGASDKLVDGLTATPLAKSLNGGTGAPVLLTKADSLPQETINELKRLGAEKVTIVGGTSAVSEAVVKELTKTYGLKVNRLSGDSRYETSMAVAEAMVNDASTTVGEFDRVFVVGGKGEADALSASAIAGKTGEIAPILLTPAGELDKDVKHFINKNVNDANKETDVYVVGGVNSVSAKVQNELVNIKVINNTDNTIEVKRLSGDGRQETNAAVIAEFAIELDGGVVVAKSDNNGMIDALSAGAVAAAKDAHIVLSTNGLVDAQEDALATVSANKSAIDTKLQVGYGVAESVIKFVNSLFKR